MANKKHTTVLIAGGSIAGLTLANILEQTGVDFLVLEKYDKIAPDLGASIAIFPNGYRILDQLGCHDAIEPLAAGAGAFDLLSMSDEKGNLVSKTKGASEQVRNRMGYAPFFFDRQMLIQILYDNLRDKSKVLTRKSVVEITQATDRVEIRTGDGDIFTGELMVAADGIHSSVRREMWRLADRDHPGYFSPKERQEVPTTYSCIFGISHSTEKFPKRSSRNVLGRNYSYLIATGPEDRIYWFLFHKLPEKVHGIDKIPRYTEQDRDTLAAEHANDVLMEGLTFGELYERRKTATLQALPEFVFEKWHYERIITIGDAAHKFNPIGGQGGNSAIEDAAVLANQLRNLWNDDTKGKRFTDAELTRVFEKTQDLRHGRATYMNNHSHELQSLEALETLQSRLLARYVVPRAGSEFILGMICGMSKGAARVEALPIPSRTHHEPWDDERAAKPFDSKVPQWLASAGFGVLAYVAHKTMRVPTAPLHATFLGTTPTTYFTGMSGFDNLLSTIVLSFSGIIGWLDIGATLQSFNLLLLLAPILLIWYIEAHRHGSQGSLISWPSIFGVAMNVFGIGVIAPIYCLLSIWSTSGASYAAAAGRHVPKATAKGILPGVLIGYVVPTVLMYLPGLPREWLQELVASWQFSAVGISGLVALFTRSFSSRKEGLETDRFEVYSKNDLHYLYTAYGTILALSFVSHVLFIGLIITSSDSSLTLQRLLVPDYASAGDVSGSHAAQMFTFLKWDFVFAVAALYFFGVYTLYELRKRGDVTSQRAVLSIVLFTIAQWILGPGATLAGLWWWRESLLARASTVSEGEGKIVEKR